MPLEQIKTQVLLLHSEQGALDKLRAGFSDRYTVHCATSGFEALNTLGETPIHVIVSANALPGMSGAEALREAKKRSPETVGILLTGDSDQQIEALAGDKDIFQVIRGGVDPKHITQLVDAATQQVNQLAGAANDKSAESDATAENIVIETGDNGATIITDGTGSFAALSPEKMAERLPAGANKVGVLVMTKDEDFLSSIKDCCRGLHEVHVANSIKKATELLTRNSIGVSVVDASLVGPNVEKLTVHLQGAKKRLVPIVAGQREDGEMLMGLINRGKVYRFLLKPASPGRIRLALEASVKHHLEGPDSAFDKTGLKAPENKKPATPPTTRPKAVPVTKAAPTVSSTPPSTVATPAPKPPAAPSKPAPAATPAPAPTPTPTPTEDVLSNSHIEKGLSGAFDEDDSRFASTVSMIVSGKKAEIQPQRDMGPALDLSGEDDDASMLAQPKVMAGIGAGVVLLAAVGFWAMSGSDEAPQTPAAEINQPRVADTATISPTISPTNAEQDALLPVDENALPASSMPEAEPANDVTSAAATASDIEPQNTVAVSSNLAAARDARDAGRLYTPVGDNALEFYSAALTDMPDDATVAAEFAETLDTALLDIETALIQGRLSAVRNGLDQISLVKPYHPRLPLLMTQLANAETRAVLDDAREAIRSGRFAAAESAIERAAAAGADTGQISALQSDLAAAQSGAQVERILERANAFLVSGQLLTPANQNARALFEQALAADPGNRSARQGLASVAAKLVLNAREDIDAGRLDEADRVLKQAAEIDAASDELEASWRALADARNAVSAEAVAKAEEEERAIREATAAAAELAARPVPVSSLNRTRYVAPKYPRAAERRGVNGWVDLMFTVGRDGKVMDIDVLGSEPGEIFVSSAVDAIGRWEFEPVQENGEVIEKRAVVRLGFALE